MKERKTISYSFNPEQEGKRKQARMRLISLFHEVKLNEWKKNKNQRMSSNRRNSGVSCKIALQERKFRFNPLLSSYLDDIPWPCLSSPELLPALEPVGKVASIALFIELVSCFERLNKKKWISCLTVERLTPIHSPSPDGTPSPELLLLVLLLIERVYSLWKKGE